MDIFGGSAGGVARGIRGRELQPLERCDQAQLKRLVARPTVDLPIFDAGRRAALVPERIAVREERIAAWRGKVDAAIRDVEKALTDLDRERAHEAALRRTVAAYTDSASLAMVVYRSGRGDYTDVVTAQRSLASAQDTLVQSEVSLARNAIALFKALGGGWGESAWAKS